MSTDQLPMAHEASVVALREQVLLGVPLRIRGGGSKDFYGNASPAGCRVIDTSTHTGILSYEPSELVISARAGTPLTHINAALAEHGQCLPFEPPLFSLPGLTASSATLGGMVACGLSGPRRMAAGSVRDFMLGARLLDGEGRVLKFGGEVMKNVAGFDVARLLTGSLGTLGLILDVSLKVLPVPLCETTLSLAMNETDAILAMNRWATQPLPISASCWCDDVLHVRLSGARAAVEAARTLLASAADRVTFGGTAPNDLWPALRDQRHPFFHLAQPDAALWRIALPTTTGPLGLGPTLIEWGGGQRWLRGDHDPALLRAVAGRAGGHATRFRGSHQGDAFTPLPAPLMALHRQIKTRLDPRAIFNPGRLYPTL